METLLPQKEFDQFVDISYNLLGIKIHDQKRELLSNRLGKRLKLLHLKTYQEYHHYLLNKTDLELPFFMEAITTNETYFFRGPKHFFTLSKEILPELKNSKVTAWSAACSSGEEAYSLIIALLERLPGGDQRDLTVFASDVSHKVLKKASEGIYQDYAMRFVKEEHKRKYFQLTPNGGYQVIPKLRNILKLGHHNLLNPFPVEPVDLIFCRNVLIYFDDQSKAIVFSQLAKALKTKGHLFVGESEIIPEIKGMKRVNSFLSCKL